MATIQIQTSVEQLLDAVAQLPPEEIAALTEKLIVLRATHSTHHVDGDEAALLLQINRLPSSELQKRYEVLINKRQNETLDTNEHDELIAISNQYEQLEYERVQALAELARLRKTSLTELMNKLGITPR
ncbi:MAG: STAS/SEC14 domain-containing protein [Chloroflexi bacterium]|nr:STAS/SEC14 domain-containing protein [Chloroflexota bacterium]MCC6895427.1 STAS/SEC14 domain-containing protein [Anaerolineae bacterium]